MDLEKKKELILLYVGDGHEQKVHDIIKESSFIELRTTFDNFDFKMLANIILTNHRNSDFHWITQYFTFNSVSSAGLDDTKPLVEDIKTFINSNYLLSKEELQMFREEFIVPVSRVLLEFFPCLKPLIPKNIKHHHH